jgi:hypothetical protein
MNAPTKLNASDFVVRANAVAAVVTLISGFFFLLALQDGIRLAVPFVGAVDVCPPLWDAIHWLTPYKPYKGAYQRSALLSRIFCMIVMYVASLLITPLSKEQVDRIIWKPQLCLATARSASTIQ